MTLTYDQDMKTWWENPYKDQVRAVGKQEDYFVVWVSDTYGSNYGYHRAVYRKFSEAYTGAIAIINSGHFARAADRTVILKINKDNQYEYEDSHVYSQEELICRVNPNREPWFHNHPG